MNETSATFTKRPAQPDRPAGEIVDRVPSPVKDFDLEKAPADRRTFANGDTDRKDQE
jgi:hypothetical protein